MDDRATDAHLISEFEGLIDRFTIIDGGREVVTLDADAARERYQRIYARFATEPAHLDLPGARVLRRGAREIEIVADGNSSSIVDRLRAVSPETLTSEALPLEEIFISALQPSESMV